MTETDSFNLTCFDDDFESLGISMQINEYYECKWQSPWLGKKLKHSILDLETHDFIELNWKCPGKRTPKKVEEITKIETPTKEQNTSLEFDFQDEPQEPSKFGTPKRQNTLSVTKKKTTTFSQIMDKMKNKNHSTPK